MDRKEQFITIKPKNPLLSSHITYYYFHKTFDGRFKRTFTYYPNYRLALNVFENSDIEWDHSKRYTLPSSTKKHTSILTFSTSKSRDVEMVGYVNKIGIIFEPLGINHFIDLPLKKILNSTIVSFNYFDDYFNEAADKVFQENNTLIKRNILDAFFVEKYRPFQNTLLVEAVQKIIQAKGNIQANDLANDLKIHRRTLLRLFDKHLSLNIQSFLSLVKFRNALALYKKTNGKVNLTQLAYDSQYYDQSSFIKHVRSFTGVTPKKLLSSFYDMGDELTLWTLKP